MGYFATQKPCAMKFPRPSAIRPPAPEVSPSGGFATAARKIQGCPARARAAPLWVTLTVGGCMEGCAVWHGRVLDAWVNLQLMTPEDGAAPARITPIGAPLTPQEARRVSSALERSIARALRGKQ